MKRKYDLLFDIESSIFINTNTVSSPTIKLKKTFYELSQCFAQMMKILKNHGRILNRMKESHHIFEKDGFEDGSVPVHGKTALSIGTERTILKVAH